MKGIERKIAGGVLESLMRWAFASSSAFHVQSHSDSTEAHAMDIETKVNRSKASRTENPIGRKRIQICERTIYQNELIIVFDCSIIFVSRLLCRNSNSTLELANANTTQIEGNLRAGWLFMKCHTIKSQHGILDYVCSCNHLRWIIRDFHSGSGDSIVCSCFWWLKHSVTARNTN